MRRLGIVLCSWLALSGHSVADVKLLYDDKLGDITGQSSGVIIDLDIKAKVDMTQFQLGKGSVYLDNLYVNSTGGPDGQTSSQQFDGLLGSSGRDLGSKGALANSSVIINKAADLRVDAKQGFVRDFSGAGDRIANAILMDISNSGNFSVGIDAIRIGEIYKADTDNNGSLSEAEKQAYYAAVRKHGSLGGLNIGNINLSGTRSATFLASALQDTTLQQALDCQTSNCWGFGFAGQGPKVSSTTVGMYTELKLDIGSTVDHNKEPKAKEDYRGGVTWTDDGNSVSLRSIRLRTGVRDKAGKPLDRGVRMLSLIDVVSEDNVQKLVLSHRMEKMDIAIGQIQIGNGNLGALDINGLNLGDGAIKIYAH